MQKQDGIELIGGQDGAFVLRASGYLGLTTCERLEEGACRALEQGAQAIDIDMREVTGVSSAAVGMLMELIDTVELAGCSMRFVRVQDSVLAMLQTLRLMMTLHSAAGTESIQPAVLLVDDDRDSCSILSLALSETPCEVLEANNTDEALKILEKHPNVFLVVADWCMPGRDGVCLLREVRTRYPWVERILLTGVQIEDNLLRALESGITNKIVTKPWKLPKFIGTVEALLKTARNRSTRSYRKDEVNRASPDAAPTCTVDVRAGSHVR